MSTRFSGILVLLGLVLVGLSLAAYTVDEREHAIKLRFGEIVKADFEPGLHFKIPVYHEVRKFPNQILTIAPNPEEILTTEK